MISPLRLASMRFRVLQYALAAAVALALCLTALSHQADQTSAHPEHAPGARLDAKGIPNFGQVAPNLYRGAQPSDEGFTTLKNMGVQIVVDLRGGNRKKEQKAVTELGMRYISLPSQCYSPNDKTFAAFLAVVRENPGKRIFVHCHVGKDRTGMAIASYRMAMEGWSAADAMNEMKAFGFSRSHHLTCPGLAEYEASFPERLKNDPAFGALHADVSAQQPK